LLLGSLLTLLGSPSPGAWSELILVLPERVVESLGLGIPHLALMSSIICCPLVILTALALYLL
jgi:hypothetical protein